MRPPGPVAYPQDGTGDPGAPEPFRALRVFAVIFYFASFFILLASLLVSFVRGSWTYGPLETAALLRVKTCRESGYVFVGLWTGLKRVQPAGNNEWTALSTQYHLKQFSSNCFLSISIFLGTISPTVSQRRETRLISLRCVFLPSVDEYMANWRNERKTWKSGRLRSIGRTKLARVK